MKKQQKKKREEKRKGRKSNMRGAWRMLESEKPREEK